MYFIHLLLNILFVTLSSGHLLSQVNHLNVGKLFFNRKKNLEIVWNENQVMELIVSLTKNQNNTFAAQFEMKKLLAKSLKCNIFLIYFCSDIYILFLSLILSVLTAVLTAAAKHWLRGWDLVSHLKGSAIAVKI